MHTFVPAVGNPSIVCFTDIIKTWQHMELAGGHYRMSQHWDSW